VVPYRSGTDVRPVEPPGPCCGSCATRPQPRPAPAPTGGDRSGRLRVRARGSVVVSVRWTRVRCGGRVHLGSTSRCICPPCCPTGPPRSARSRFPVTPP